MIRRIALTLGMGVAAVAAGNRMTPSMTAAESTPALHMAAGVKPVSPKLPGTIHRSGYIVASS
jgi:multidrug resistance efflux pump